MFREAPSQTRGGASSTNWLHQLSLPWLALLALGVMFVIAAAIYVLVIALASGDGGNASTRSRC